MSEHPLYTVVGGNLTDAELLQIATEFRNALLGSRSSHCMCRAVCWPLEGLLRTVYGVDCESEEAPLDGEEYPVLDHVFLELSDGRVLDPTADQFGADVPPVYLGERLPFHGELP